MVDSTRYKDWIVKAEVDLNSANILIGNDGVESSIAFHSQQATEKIIKAFLLVVTGGVVSGHSLAYLLRQCKKHDSSFDEIEDCIYVLDDYYIETRYPADMPLDITKEDAQKSIENAEEVIKFVKTKIDEI